MFCVVCIKTFSISWGFEAVEQHAASRKHKEECRQKLSSSQLRLAAVRSDVVSVPEESAVTEVKKHVQLYSVRDTASTAELIWLMKAIVSDFSMSASCENIFETFEAMFPSSVPKTFSLSRTKAHYLATDALAPFFKEQMLKDMNGKYFTLCYDETTNAASQKELQIKVKYWSESKQMVVTRHLQTFFMGSATANDLYSKLNEALDNAQLSRSKLLMLSNDGPNVNKAVTRLMNDSLILSGRKSMVDIGTCNIHVVHNAFRRGMQELGDDASNLIFLIHDFFDGWPARWDNFTKLQNELKVPNHRFIKHVSSRWLSLEPAGERLLEQWQVVLKYFMDFVPKYKSCVMKSFKYKSIVSLLKSKTMKAEVMFACSTARLFTRFTGIFQKEEPLVHIMHDELKTLASTVMSRVCHSSAPFSLDTFDDDKCYLPLKDINCGGGVAEELRQLSEKDRVVFLQQAKNHYVASCKHIFSNSSLKSKPLLRNLQCLIPSERVKEGSYKYIVKVAKSFPVEFEEGTLVDEWKLMSMEEDERDCENSRIDVYWNQFFKKTNAHGNSKYPTVMEIVKAALSLSHGSGDVERGFSSSGRTLTADRASMSERTLNAHLHVKGALQQIYDGKVHLVQINKELLELARTAHVRYEQHCEEERRIKEQKEREKEEKEKQKAAEKELEKRLLTEKGSIDEKESTLKRLRDEEGEKRLTADRLLKDANERLKEAIKNKDLVAANVAQAMLEGVTKVKEEADKKKEDADKVKKKLKKGNHHLLHPSLIKGLGTETFNKKQ